MTETFEHSPRNERDMKALFRMFAKACRRAGITSAQDIAKKWAEQVHNFGKQETKKGIEAK